MRKIDDKNIRHKLKTKCKIASDNLQESSWNDGTWSAVDALRDIWYISTFQLIEMSNQIHRRLTERKQTALILHDACENKSITDGTFYFCYYKIRIKY